MCLIDFIILDKKKFIKVCISVVIIVLTFIGCFLRTSRNRIEPKSPALMYLQWKVLGPSHTRGIKPDSDVLRLLLIACI